MATLAAAQAAKVSLEARFAGQPWFLGVSMAQRSCIGDNAPFEPTVNIRERAAMRFVPKVWMGVPVQIGIWPEGLPALGASAVGAQDLANVALGAITLTATFLMGKIAVDSIIQSRREHFDRKGQPPTAVKARETTGDGIMKLVGAAFSIWQLTQQFPEVVAEAKRYLP